LGNTITEIVPIWFRSKSIMPVNSYMDVTFKQL